MSWSSSGQCCLNCAFWQGCRSQKYRGVRWESDHPSDRGKCAKNVFCGVTSGPCACEGRQCREFIELPYK